MPIYAFECATCGHSFDRLQRLSDADPTHCPECAAEAVFRQLTAPQFRLSGSGWYETDFKGDGDKKRNLAGEGGAPKPETSGDAASPTATADKKSDASVKPTDAKPSGSSSAAGTGKSDSSSTKSAAPKPTPSSTD
ncbi:MAG: zinc ribbon domain-containing protein [Lysobacter sp.]|nr:zinc ribbon domain-containing protein [Lysobacter sp.]MDQ3268741.1 zinc ribbon domain-containing protein [Pseudomonadota bacterium]